ncbi:hypothetical protein B0H11DRAFT_1898616 [Mycena galericulata]|nr:hypothetical protein B0H11DRAFT_1898616 [Mycena galericulata]
MAPTKGSKNGKTASTAKPAKPAKAPSARKRKPSAKAKAAEKAAKKAAKKKRSTDELPSDDDSDTSSSDDEDELDIEEANSGILSVDWSDPALSEALIARIMEDKDIKRALYPPPGPNASTAKGGGKSKVESQWQLCLNLLEEHPKYKEALAAVTTKKERTAYANKIKNRLRAYV